MNKTMRQIFWMVGAIVLIAAAVAVAIRLTRSGRERLSKTAQGTGETQASDGSREAYYEQTYGTLDMGTVEVSLLDPEGLMDVGRINSLPCYIAKPLYQDDERARELAAYFWGSGDYDTDRQDYASITEGAMKGWGDRYRLSQKERSESIEVSEHEMTFVSDDGRTQEKPEAFLEEFCGRFAIGLWEDGKNLLEPERLADTDGQDEIYEMRGMLNGLPIRYSFPSMYTELDTDGARYRAWTAPQFHYDGSDLKMISNVFSAEITGSEGLHNQYRDKDELIRTIEEGIYGMGMSDSVIEVEPVLFCYTDGFTESGEYRFTPWVILRGETAQFNRQSGGWEVMGDIVLSMNLSTGDCFFESNFQAE